jgi:hypothetical protein
MRTMMIVAALAAGGCAHIHAQVSPNTDVKQWKSAYLQPLAQDEFNMASFITNELHAMDVEVFLRPEPEQPQAGDVLVRYDYYDGWDMGKYLKSFQIRFLEPSSEKLLASVDYRFNGNLRDSNHRVMDAFKKLREEAAKSTGPAGR